MQKDLKIDCKAKGLLSWDWTIYNIFETFCVCSQNYTNDNLGFRTCM